MKNTTHEPIKLQNRRNRLDFCPEIAVNSKKVNRKNSFVYNHPNFGGVGRSFCTGPPGRARSPGARGHPPDTSRPAQAGGYVDS